MKRLMLICLAAVMLAACEDIFTPKTDPDPEPLETQKEISFLKGNEVAVDIEGGSVTVQFEAPQDWSATVDDESWCKVEPTSGAKGENTITITIEENEAVEPRITFITIKSGKDEKPVSVRQEGRGMPIAIIGEGEVDLGLSVKWASCNLGASKPEERGDLFAWGETATRKAGSKFYINNYTKDRFYRPSGDFDTRRHLSDDDDAATAILGNMWRMPTQEEVSELLGLTIKYPFAYNDNSGLLVVAKSGNALFVPASGYEIGYAAPAANINEVVCFWTNEVATMTEDNALCLMSHIEGSSVAGLPFITGSPMSFYRCGGMPVRGVRRADIKMSELQAETSETSATLSVGIDMDGVDMSKIVKAGFIYSEQDVFSYSKQLDTLFCTPANASMSYKWDGLSSGKTYSVRPFLIVEKEGNYTAPAQSFTTK